MLSVQNLLAIIFFLSEQVISNICFQIADQNLSKCRRLHLNAQFHSLFSTDDIYGVIFSCEIAQ